jgi:glycosyltransferase involved in cell wall biosynthesis
MKVSGFTFIRDGVRLGYPFEESIRSVLPLCDEFIVAVGDSDDGTLERLESMNEPKLRLIRTAWNENIHSYGFVYAQQKMIAQFNCTGDWAFYLEGDEIVHEEDLDRLHRAMAHYIDVLSVEALVFDYFHFYGDVRHVDISSRVYRKAARIIRNNLRSIAPDGLYWAIIKKRNWLRRRNKRRTRYPHAAALNIPIYHYGNARAEHFLGAKAAVVNQYWGEEIWPSKYGRIDPQRIGPFRGTHPQIIRPWLESHANEALNFDPEYRITPRERKHRLLGRLEKHFGWDFSKRHFKIIANFE